MSEQSDRMEGLLSLLYWGAGGRRIKHINGVIHANLCHMESIIFSPRKFWYRIRILEKYV